MKKREITIAVILLFVLSFNLAFSQSGDNFPVLKGEYLGQKPPGIKPEKFATGIISTNINEGCSGWGNKMEYFIFQRWIGGKSMLYIMNRINGEWSKPKLLPFVEKYQVGDFTIAPDGKTIFFASNIFIDEIGSEGEGGNIWTVEKGGTDWTEPKHIGAPVNTKYHDSYPCAAENGTLYFFSRRPGGYGKSDLYFARQVNGKYSEPVNMGENFNTDDHEWDSFIAPDQSYLIYCSYKGSIGRDDFFISFKEENGSWSKPVHMGGEINSTASENRPYVTNDGKYFFFTSNKEGNRDIYWVSTKIFERFKKMAE